MTGDQHKMNSMFCLGIFYLINFLFVHFDFHFCLEFYFGFGFEREKEHEVG